MSQLYVHRNQVKQGSESLEVALPFDREFEIWKESFEADHLDLDYDLFIASLSEYDYQTICEEYKDELQIEYLESDEGL